MSIQNVLPANLFNALGVSCNASAVHGAIVVVPDSKRRDLMELSAPTKIVFIIAVILAILSLLPVIGIAAGVLGAYSYWLLLLAFIVLAAGNLLKGV